VDQIGPLDVDWARREALAVLDHLTADEAAVEEAIWQTGRQQRLRLTRADAKQLKIAHPVTYGKRAESLRFEIEHLALGSTVPDIEGTDADDGFFKLSDYRGKIVVLMFSANWCGPCLAMYPDNRQLVEKHRGQPFASLSVMGDDDRQGLREKVRSWPTIYVLDHRARIAYRGLRGPSLERAVARLLAARDRDPAAGKTVDFDPFEQSPCWPRSPCQAGERRRVACESSVSAIKASSRSFAGRKAVHWIKSIFLAHGRTIAVNDHLGHVSLWKLADEQAD
jgi:thiol-disulfide isomerase/thioredoxin